MVEYRIRVVVDSSANLLGKPYWSLIERGLKTLNCILSPLAISN